MPNKDPVEEQEEKKVIYNSGAPGCTCVRTPQGLNPTINQCCPCVFLGVLIQTSNLVTGNRCYVSYMHLVAETVQIQLIMVSYQ